MDNLLTVISSNVLAGVVYAFCFMGKKKKDTSGFLDFFFANRSQPVQAAITAVLSAAITVFLLLSSLGAAGVVGDTTFSTLSSLLGIGYWIAVILLVGLTYNLLLSDEDFVSFSWRHLVSGIIFLLSLLALIEMLAGGGGQIGSFLAEAVVAAFDVYAGAVLLETIAAISLLVIFDEHINLSQPISLPKIQLAEWFKKLFTLGEATEDKETKNQNDSTESENNAQKTKTETDQTDSKKNKKKTTAQGDKDEETNLAGLDKVIAGDYSPPPVDLLSTDEGTPDVGDVKARANLIKRTLENFNINVEMDEVSIGPTVTRYALKPAEGVRLSKITNLQNNLELALAAHPVRIEAPIPGKSLVGIEVPNEAKTTVGLAELISADYFDENSEPLLLALGQGVSGRSYYANLSSMPHLLIGGATGAGKSVTVHSLINSLLFRNGPNNLKFIMVDPKRVELTLYNGIPHLLTPVITSAKKAILALKWAAQEMENRYDILEENSARDIDSYHKNVLPKLKKKAKKSGGKKPEPMPYIVVIIDEMADLMSAYPKELESVIVRIAQMSRAVGIHLILSTQRPSVNVITGLIKANIPARIALQVSSQVDSRTILDSKGAEQLLGAGDMLYQSGDMSSPKRIQSAFISEAEVKKVAKYLKDQYEDKLQDRVSLTEGDKDSKTIFDVARETEEQEERDDKYEEALETVLNADKASTSYLQRKLRVGYSRAARIMDELEEDGIISEKDGTKARDVLVSKEEIEEARTETEEDEDKKREPTTEREMEVRDQKEMESEVEEGTLSTPETQEDESTDTAGNETSE